MLLGFKQLLIFFLVIGAIFVLTRSLRLGFWRGTVPALLRCFWVSALFSVFFPKAEEIVLPPAVKSSTLHVLIDDSRSMTEIQEDGSSYLDQGNKVLSHLTEVCPAYGCIVEISKLSDLAPNEVSKGFTPLKRETERFLLSSRRDQWVLISDGGDISPELPWTAELSAKTSLDPTNSMKQGFIVGFDSQKTVNYWIENVVMPPFAFEQQNFEAEVVVARTGDLEARETLQIQVHANTNILASHNVSFQPGDQSVSVKIPLSPLSRGFHFVSVQALPVVGEKYIWDNRRHVSLEVLADTVGILHLLGSPSWDGRYLRRYLKSEPKYDLISFFILRDPTDSQRVNERELSLIPFPVDRLFTEELGSFRLVILQNFAMHQFLLPEYQKNLVEFVKNGGALLFLGGSRALYPADVENTPLKEILPFELRGSDDGNNATPSMLARRLSSSPYSLSTANGPAFDSQESFKITLANPDWEKRALAGVYDDWIKIIPRLDQFGNFQGRHRMEWVAIKDADVTPLLMASTPAGGGQAQAPLALASYPGSGRAIWLFTDSLWQIAANGTEEMSSQTYYDLIHSAMGWLLREEISAPLVISRFEVIQRDPGNIMFSAKLDGASVKYLELSDAWSVRACGVEMQAEDMALKKLSDTNVLLTGQIKSKLEAGERCDFMVKGVHKAFGSVEARSANVLANEYDDSQIAAVPSVLKDLARQTGATLDFYNETTEQKLDNWLSEVTGKEGIALPAQQKVQLQYYWLLNSWLFALVLAALILDIVFFRWRELTGRDA